MQLNIIRYRLSQIIHLRKLKKNIVVIFNTTAIFFDIDNRSQYLELKDQKYNLETLQQKKTIKPYREKQLIDKRSII